MRLFGILIALMLGGVGSWWFFLRDDVVSSADVLAELRSQGDAFASADITLTGCQFTAHATLGSDPITLTTLQADLSLFEFASVRLQPVGTRMRLIANRRAVSEAMLDQAQKFMALTPAAKNDDTTTAPLSRADLTKAIATPDKTFTTQLTVAVKEDGSFEPHPDAPAFYEFATAVTALEAPTSSTSVLTFTGKPFSGDTLITGAVQFPALLAFETRDAEAAKAFTKTLYLYQRANCPDHNPIRFIDNS